MNRFLFCFLLLWSITLSTAQTYKFAAVQYPVAGGQSLQQFLDKVEGYIVEAKQQNADVIIFPELCTFDTWPLATKMSEQKVCQQIAQNITAKFFEKITEWSQSHEIAILAGSSPNLKNGEVYNTALMAFPDGKTIYQDKIFLTHWEKDMQWKGANTLNIFSTPWGKTVILICYDSEFPVISNQLAEFSPEIILVPSMTEDQYGLRRVRWSSQARAIEHHSYVVVTGTVGKISESWDNVGQAVFLTPSEKGFPGLLKSGDLDKTQIVYAELDFAQLAKSRSKKSHLYPAKDQAKKEQIQINQYK